MPTRDRPRFVSQAIWYFLRQDYPARELIVVDDGQQSVADLIPADPRIRHVRTAAATAGAKRNLACSLAAGELIAHWDDDTWYSPRRLTAQVHELQQTGAEVAALDRLLYYQPVTGRVWQQNGPGPATVLHPGSLIYRRGFWAGHRSRDADRDGMLGFVRQASAGRIAVREGADLAVAVLHGSGTRPVNPADPGWLLRPFDELSRVLALDLGFYARLRGDTAPARHFQAVAPITLAATFLVYDGYGSMAEYLALGLARAGADIRLAPFRIDPTGISPELRDLWQRSKPDPDGIVLCHAWWGENLARFGSAGDLFIKTVWETSRLPADWPARLDHARAVIVPSDFAARVFRESGVRAPIEVVHEGVDSDVYPYLERPERPGLTTLIVGVLAPRKNFRQAVAAWQRAFAGDPEARLIIKARFQVERFTPDDPRIQVVDQNEPTRGILHWYRQADVLLALGNEGFGLPLIEGMATGLPVVALDSEAQADVIAARAGAERLALPVRAAAWEAVESPLFGRAGVRALPDVEAAARQLRWVADHRDDARELGRRASRWAHAERNVWRMGPALLEVIERHSRTPRPLRRTSALWAPRGAGSAGVAAYVDNLARALPRVRVYDRPPVAGGRTAWRSPVLHIQHAPGLIDDAELTREVQAARHAGLAVVVTEHRVGDRAEAWEQAASALVAIDPAGAAALRARWPRKQVEWIPPGCPPWRPLRRPAGGQTIAVIGDPGAEIEEFVETLVALPAARLLVFLPPVEHAANRPLADPAPAARWCAAARRPARKIPLRFAGLPDPAALAESALGDKLARRLNEEVDVVVWWDDERDQNYRCLAGTALASGAPVVAAPARVDGRPADPPALAGLADPVFRPANLAAGLQEIFGSPPRRAELAAAAEASCAELSWSRIAARHLALWRTLAS